jgi:hypothetical protein
MQTKKALVTGAWWGFGRALALAWLAHLPLFGQSRASGYVQVSQTDPRYLALDHGQTYIPIGVNVCFPRFITSEPEILAYYEHYFKKISANGGNATRIWLSAPAVEVEPAQAGQYDAGMAKRLDRILALAAKYQIKVKFCLEHFRTTDRYPPKFPGSIAFDRPAYHGVVANMDSFFLSAKGKALFLQRVDFFAHRYAQNPTVFGWELWNEINSVRVSDPATLANWTVEMLPELKKRFPHQLVMQSLGSFDDESKISLYATYAGMKGNEVVQIHRYLDLGADLAVCKGAYGRAGPGCRRGPAKKPNGQTHPPLRNRGRGTSSRWPLVALSQRQPGGFIARSSVCPLFLRGGRHWPKLALGLLCREK